MNRSRSPTTSTTPFSMRRIQATVDLGRIGRGGDRIQRRRRQGRDDLQRFDGPRGEPLEAILDELLQAIGDREPFSGRHVTSAAKERQSDLLREEGIAPRHLVEAQERGPVEPLPDLVPEHPFEGVQRQRSHVDGVHAILGEDRRDAQGIVIRIGASSGRHQADRLVLQAPNDELEHPDRREVHPLDVIDRHHDRDVEATDRRHPRTARDTARWSARAPELGERKRATSRARRCGSGTVGSASSRTGSRRSPRAA